MRMSIHVVDLFRGRSSKTAPFSAHAIIVFSCELFLCSFRFGHILFWFLSHQQDLTSRA